MLCGHDFIVVMLTTGCYRLDWLVKMLQPVFSQLLLVDQDIRFVPGAYMFMLSSCVCLTHVSSLSRCLSGCDGRDGAEGFLCG